MGCSCFCGSMSLTAVHVCGCQEARGVPGCQCVLGRLCCAKACACVCVCMCACVRAQTCIQVICNHGTSVCVSVPQFDFLDTGSDLTWARLSHLSCVLVDLAGVSTRTVASDLDLTCALP